MRDPLISTLETLSSRARMYRARKENMQKEKPGWDRIHSEYKGKASAFEEAAAIILQNLPEPLPKAEGIDLESARAEAQAFRDRVQDCKWPKHRFSWENPASPPARRGNND